MLATTWHWVCLGDDCSNEQCISGGCERESVFPEVSSSKQWLMWPVGVTCGDSAKWTRIV